MHAGRRTDTRTDMQRAGLGGLLQQLDVTHNQLLPVHKSHSALLLREQLSLHQGFLKDLRVEERVREQVGQPGPAQTSQTCSERGAPGGPQAEPTALPF